MNGLTMFQIKVHNKYSCEDIDLRQMLRRSGCKEKICFILNKSNVTDSSFLKRMNTLLANDEVPGLFEGGRGAQRQGLMLNTNEGLYKWFAQQVMKNFHVVLTMHPSSDGLKDRAATSPLLFNRCVFNWVGNWTNSAFFQVGRDFTIKMDLEQPSYQAPDYFPVACPIVSLPPNHRDAVVNAMVFVHQSLYKCNVKIIRKGGHVMAITPRHFFDFILINLANQDIDLKLLLALSGDIHPHPGPTTLSISRELANSLYSQAGANIGQFQRNFSQQGELEVAENLKKEIENARLHLRLPYSLQDFQVNTVAALSQNKNVILVAPTGVGKSVIMDITCEVIRARSGKENGVVICCVPLDSIMKNKSLMGDETRGYVTMSGTTVVTEGEEGNKEELNVSCSMAAILDGSVRVLMAHPESWTTREGRKLIKELTAAGLVLAWVHDEVHLSLLWGKSIRPEMLEVPAQLQILAPEAPSLFMSATLSDTNIQVMQEEFCIEEPSVLIKCSPVQPQHLYVNLERPPSCYSFNGSKDGSHPGLKHLLDRIILDPIVDDLLADRKPKKTLIMCKDSREVGYITQELNSRLPHLGQRGILAPWVKLHSHVGPVTTHEGLLRTDADVLIGTIMLGTGVDIPGFEVVVIVDPFCTLDELVQIVGRSGRMQEGGEMVKCLTYMLWNNTDLSSNTKGMTEEVRQYVRKDECLKKILEEHYSCGLIPSLKLPDWCCSVCSLEGKLQPVVWEVEAIEEDEMDFKEDVEEGFEDEAEADQSCNANEEELLALIDSM